MSDDLAALQSETEAAIAAAAQAIAAVRHGEMDVRPIQSYN